MKQMKDEQLMNRQIAFLGLLLLFAIMALGGCCGDTAEENVPALKSTLLPTKTIEVLKTHIIKSDCVMIFEYRNGEISATHYAWGKKGEEVWDLGDKVLIVREGEIQSTIHNPGSIMVRDRRFE